MIYKKYFSNEINEEDSAFEDAISYLMNDKIYMYLIIIDLTYLNENDENSGREVGTSIKDYMANYFNYQNKVVFQKIIGGKLFFITQKKVSTQFKEELDKEIKKIFSINKKIMFIIEDAHEPFKQDINDLFIEAISYEKNLNIKRAVVQKRIFDENFYLVNQKLSKSILNDSKKVFSLVKSSSTLTQAYRYYYTKNYESAYRQMVKYMLWIKLQQILFRGYKTEKVDHLVDYSNQKFKFDTSFLNEWFLSTIKPLENYFSSKQKQDMKEIEKMISNSELTNSELNYLTTRIQEFSKELNVIGVFNIPLDRLRVSDTSFLFLKRQFFLLYGTNIYQTQLDSWLNSNFIKQHYKIATKGSVEDFYCGFIHINTGIKNGEDILLGFLELDGFNAFNNYLFPNDSDSVYNQIIDVIYESANDFLIKYPQLFKTMCVSIMGDEFFFAFKQENMKSSSIIIEYFNEVQKKVLSLTQNHKFFNTEKIEISSQEGALRFRKLIEGSNYKFDLAYLGVSGVLISSKFNKKKFYENYDHLDNLMKNVKRHKKGNILFIDKRKQLMGKITSMFRR